MNIKNFIITVFAILILFTSSVYSKNINVELISYEEKEDILQKGKYNCQLEFTFTNNSWGTMYGLKVDTESYDDRDDKMSEYAFAKYIDPFAGMFSKIDKIGLGNNATSKSLHLKGKCKYVSVIKMKQVKPNHCNIRQMPEDANCLDIITASSKIDHIKLIKK
tara:strand:- start:347 stop:835 length:489 start_codon:yes stop_codon:yes gene_type:complete